VMAAARRPAARWRCSPGAASRPAKLKSPRAVFDQPKLELLELMALGLRLDAPLTEKKKQGSCRLRLRRQWANRRSWILDAERARRLDG